MAAEQKVIIYYKILASNIYSNLFSFWCQQLQRNFSLQIFLCSGEIEFLREGENCFLFNFLRAETRPGPAFPQLQETGAEHQQPPPLAARAHYASSRLLLRECFIWLSVPLVEQDPLHYYKSVPVAPCLIVIGCLSTPNKTSTNFFPFVTSALISLCFVAASISFFTEKMS